jgi:NDP-sugar pyrophosphorylase family protein
MKALVLAAGEGTRLRPLTLRCPKPMLPVGDRPLLEHILSWLVGYGVDDIAINLHYLPDSVTGHLGDGSRLGVRLTYSHEDPILGSAGAARKLAWYLDQPFVVVYGDLLLDVDLNALLEYHGSTGAAVTVGLKKTHDPSSNGMVDVDATGRVLRFVEKPVPGPFHGDLANAGVYVVEPGVLRWIPSGRFYDFGHDLFPALLAADLPIYAALLRGYLLDIGTHEAYRRAQEDFAAGHVRG